ncbi:amino acid ABC transporter permease [Mesorhizobium sp. B2-4-19]|uniref:amino acid ABC transporter permease n=1 Tax=Mesorhizobium sp. B2-4-19 TaxID=2589930 RepID=UPI0015E35FA4|nr:amino acid ABC transporter permease [Mesorhizobium sp. B2-4-19]
MVEFAATYSSLYLKGLMIGLGLTVAAMAGAFLIGLFVALARVSQRRWLRMLGGAYVALFRGIPPLVLLYLVYFGLPAWAAQIGNSFLITLLGPLDNRLLAATLAFSINAGAYTTEIIRASIQALPADQMEAARSVGMTYGLAMRRIVLPQSLRIAFPPLCNEFIVILKGTSLASVIGVTELMRSAQMTAAATFLNLQAYMLAAVFYVAAVILLQALSSLIEVKILDGGARS